MIEETGDLSWAGTAADLCHESIGLIVTFDYRYKPSGVKGLITGELRQVYAVSGEVTVNLCAPDQEFSDLEEFTLPPEESVSLHVRRS